MANGKKMTKGSLRDLCEAHTQLVQAREEHLKGSGSEILVDFFEQKISELQGEITGAVKVWLGREKVKKG